MATSDRVRPLCKDCEHFKPARLHDQCKAFLDPISGDAGAFCDIERQGAGHKTGCGADGRKFKQRPPRRTWHTLWLRKA